jgi:hypothetical protein
VGVATIDVMIAGYYEDILDTTAGRRTELLIEPLICEIILGSLACKGDVAGKKNSVGRLPDLGAHLFYVLDHVVPKHLIGVAL